MANKEEKEELTEAEKSLTKQDPPPTLLSWGIRGISLLMVIAIIGYFVNVAIQPTDPPAFEITPNADKIAQREGGWVVPVTILNTGDMCVLGLQVASSENKPANGESSSTTPRQIANVGLLGTQEEVTVEFWFSNRPNLQEVDFSVTSYLLP